MIIMLALHTGCRMSGQKGRTVSQILGRYEIGGTEACTFESRFEAIGERSLPLVPAATTSKHAPYRLVLKVPPHKPLSWPPQNESVHAFVVDLDHTYQVHLTMDINSS